MIHKINPLLLSSSDLSQITGLTIKDFVKNDLDENYTVELKTYSKTDTSCLYKIRKAVASLANQQGGFVIIGLKDKKNSRISTDITERIIGHSIKGEIQKWTDDVCGKNLLIPRVSYRAKNLTMSGRDVAVIAVEPYLAGPVGVKKSEDSLLEFWIRGNGSDIPMDYMDLSKKYQNNQSGLISASFIDLMDTYRDLYELHKNPPKLDALNPIRIVSSVLDDRMSLYALTNYNHKLINHINNLRRTLPVINTVLDLGNSSHTEGKVIGNSDELSKQVGHWADIASKEIISVISELYFQFPEIGKTYIQSLENEYDLDIK